MLPDPTPITRPQEPAPIEIEKQPKSVMPLSQPPSTTAEIFLETIDNLLNDMDYSGAALEKINEALVGLNLLL